MENVPDEVAHHYGAFVIKPSQVNEYLAAFKPQVLRWLSMGRSYLPPSLSCQAFGSSKGLGLDRVLVISPDKHLSHLGGDLSVFDKDKTDESRNKLCVAITRASYSLAFVVDDEHLENVQLSLWNGTVQAVA